MPRLTIAGHPLHAVFSDWPVALLSGVSVFDALYLRTRKMSYAKTAQYLQTGGFFAGLIAALAGAVEYTTIPDRHRELKSDANMHALLNVGVMGLTALSLFIRKKGQVPSGKLPFLLSAVSSLGLLASAWYGGEMVYRHGMRVKGVSPVEDSPEFEIPMSNRVSHALSSFSSRLA